MSFSPSRHSPQGFYARCSSKKLRDFIVSRGLETREIANKLHEKACIARLEQGDRERMIRFLDFPAEIRNRVYALVLPVTVDKIHKGMEYSRSILKANRQIRREAWDFLYGSNVVLTLKRAKPETGTTAEPKDDSELSRINTALERMAMKSVSETVIPEERDPVDAPEKRDTVEDWKQIVNVNDVWIGIPDNENRDLLRGSLPWPEHILKSKVLNVTIDLSMLKGSSCKPSDFFLLNHALYDLHCISYGRADWEHVSVFIQVGSQSQDKKLEEFLSPLQLLTGTKHWESMQGVPTDICKNLDTTPTPPASGREFNPFGRRQKLFDDYGQLQSILDDLDLRINIKEKPWLDWLEGKIRKNTAEGILYTPKRDAELRQQLNAFGVRLRGFAEKLDREKDVVLERVQRGVAKLRVFRSRG